MLRLPSFIDSHMVIQADAPIRLWGWADPTQQVRVSLDTSTMRCSAGDDGRWLCVLPPLPAGREVTLTISAGDERLLKTDILTGEVWLCAGQSNMGHAVGQTTQAADAATDAAYPDIRFFTVATKHATEPADDCGGAWLECSSETVRGFSGVGFHFARALHQSLRVPIGVVVCSEGNTSVKQWVSRETLQSFDTTGELLRESRRSALRPCEDPGIQPPAERWHEPDFDDSAWESLRLPAGWIASGFDFNGAVWFRRKFDVPENWCELPCVLSLGILNDFDIAFVNGVQVGNTGVATPVWWTVPRCYTIPAGTLHARDNTVSFRLFNRWDDGGVAEEVEHRMRVRCAADPTNEVLLAGQWRQATEVRYPMRSVTTSQPCGLYHGMIAPLEGFGIRGFAWYQGETDVGSPEDYRVLFPGLIRNWRRRWNQGELPFLFVQLPKYTWPAHDPSQGRLPLFREVQASALSLEGTAMAVALDLGDPTDIHPDNKRDVGLRLSLLALNVVYKKDVEDEGPRFEGATREGRSVRIRFSHARGLCAQGALEGFELAGDSGAFFPAQAAIEEIEVVVSTPQVHEPRAVRYAWSDCPPHPLYNAAGLPAAPFRGDVADAESGFSKPKRY